MKIIKLSQEFTLEQNVSMEEEISKKYLDRLDIEILPHHYKDSLINKFIDLEAIFRGIIYFPENLSTKWSSIDRPRLAPRGIHHRALENFILANYSMFKTKVYGSKEYQEELVGYRELDQLAIGDIGVEPLPNNPKFSKVKIVLFTKMMERS